MFAIVVSVRHPKLILRFHNSCFFPRRGCQPLAQPPFRTISPVLVGPDSTSHWCWLPSLPQSCSSYRGSPGLAVRIGIGQEWLSDTLFIVTICCASLSHLNPTFSVIQYFNKGRYGERKETDSDRQRY